MGLKQFFNKKNIISLFIVFIMIGSVMGIIFSGFGGDTSQKQRYGDYVFTFTDNQWVTTIDKQNIYFMFLPAEVETINLSSEIIDKLQNTMEIDITSDENDSFSEGIALAQYRLSFGLNPLNIYLRRGFLTNNSFGLPVFGCEDSMGVVPVIYFKQSNQTKIYLENCIIAEIESEQDAVRIADRLLYGIMGIIE